MVPWLLAGGLFQAAEAGDDPWIAPKKTANVFVATSAERFQDFAGATGSISSIDAPIWSAGGKLYARYGLGRDMDVSLDVPVARAWSSGPQSGMYEPTLGVGIVQAEVRRRWLSNAPVGIGTRAAVRTGVLHQDSRGRLTNLGEGSTDVGLGVGLGRLGLTGRGFVTLDAGATWWYRFSLESGDVPADEISWTSNAVFTATQRIGVGLTTSGLHRLGGQDLGSVTVEDPANQWAALQANQIKVGGRIAIYSKESRPSVSIAAMRTVWARNNPIDTTIVEIGLGWDIRRTP